MGSSIVCLVCNRQIAVSARDAGTTILCPICRTPISLPGAAAAKVAGTPSDFDLNVTEELAQPSAFPAVNSAQPEARTSCIIGGCLVAAGMAFITTAVGITGLLYWERTHDRGLVAQAKADAANRPVAGIVPNKANEKLSPAPTKPSVANPTAKAPLTGSPTPPPAPGKSPAIPDAPKPIKGPVGPLPKPAPALTPPPGSLESPNATPAVGQKKASAKPPVSEIPTDLESIGGPVPAPKKAAPEKGGDFDGPIEAMQEINYQIPFKAIGSLKRLDQVLDLKASPYLRAKTDKLTLVAETKPFPAAYELKIVFGLLDRDGQFVNSEWRSAPDLFVLRLIPVDSAESPLEIRIGKAAVAFDPNGISELRVNKKALSAASLETDPDWSDLIIRRTSSAQELTINGGRKLPLSRVQFKQAIIYLRNRLDASGTPRAYTCIREVTLAAKE